MFNWFWRHAPLPFKLGFAFVSCCAPLPVSFWLALRDSSRLASAATRGVLGEMQRAMMTAGDANLIFCAVVAPICIVNALLVYRMVAPSHRILVERTESLADGDFSTPVPFRNRSDCIGRLARSLEACRRNAKSAQEHSDRYREIIDGLSRSHQIAATVATPSIEQALQPPRLVVRAQEPKQPPSPMDATPSVWDPRTGPIEGEIRLRGLLDRLRRHRDGEGSQYDRSSRKRRQPHWAEERPLRLHETHQLHSVYPLPGRL